MADRYLESTDPSLIEAAARARVGLIESLMVEERSSEALAVCSDTIERFRKSDDEETLDQVGQTYARAAEIAYLSLDDREKGNALLAESAEVFCRYESPRLRAHAMHAYYLRGAPRRAAGDVSGAVSEWDAAMGIWRDSNPADSPEIQVPLGRVLTSNGAARHELGQYLEAQRDYQSVFEYCHNLDDPRIMVSVANAATGLTELAFDHGGEELFQLALDLTQSVIATGIDSDDESVKVATAEALLMRAKVHSIFGENEDAIRNLQGIYALYSSVLSCSVIVSEALLMQAHLLEDSGRVEEAISVYEQLMSEFADIEHPDIDEAIEKSRAAVQRLEEGRDA